MYINTTGFPSIREISGLMDTDDAVSAMDDLCRSIRTAHKRIVKMPFSTIIFTGVVEDRYPGNFSRLIKRAKLGDVICTNPKVNPNSDNVIRAYIWHVDIKALSKWFAKHRRKYDNLYD